MAYQKKEDTGERRKPEPRINVRACTKDGTLIRGEVNLGQVASRVRRKDSVLIDGHPYTLHDVCWAGTRELQIVVI